ncbi:MAG TPA: N-acetylneuraminate synthase family protein [Phnomibacter sp.]|nr:N-acetylneuraminate synthase family protein [Phnomibacter sp.]
MAYLIAEIAQAHDGSLGLAHSYIDALADTGVHAVKFQVHIAEAESSSAEPFRVKFSSQDATRFDYWKRMQFSQEQWQELKNHCEAKGLEFLATPFSIAAVALLENIGANRYKVGSGDTNNLLLLEKIAATQKPVILSSGMSSWDELETAINFLRKKQTTVSLLQCTTAYPTPAHQWGLQYIAEMKKRFHIPVGYSDHSGTPAACLAAATLGAEILEFHTVFNKQMFGPDATSSLTIDEIKWLATSVAQVGVAMQPSNMKDDVLSFEALKNMFGRSIAINKNTAAGAIIRLEDLETKKPANQGIPVDAFEKVIGRKLSVEKNKWDFLQWSDFE